MQLNLLERSDGQSSRCGAAQVLQEPPPRSVGSLQILGVPLAGWAPLWALLHGWEIKTEATCLGIGPMQEALQSRNSNLTLQD